MPYNFRVSNFKKEFESSVEWSKLTVGQKDFAKAFFSGRNIMLNGSAGTGKSFVINSLFKFLEKKGRAASKTATTGVASFNIEGQTIYSYAGLGLGDEDAQTIIKNIKKNGKARDRIFRVKSLLIDEVSMLKAGLFDKIDLIFKYFRMNNLPFGGCQIILSGDFLQIQPVWKGDEEKDFVFNSRSWREADFKLVNLTESMRHNNDKKFDDFLNKIRIGDTSDLSLLNPCIGRKFKNDGIQPIYIYCKNVDVDIGNKRKLAEIKSPSKFFYSKDSGLKHHIDAFDKNCQAAKIIELKVGAQVMLLRNISVEEGFVNGSIGTVESFTNNGVSVKFKNGSSLVEDATWEIKEQEVGISGEIKYRVVATRTQIPLRVAYYSTVHKCLSENTLIHTIDGIKPLSSIENDKIYSHKSGSNNIVAIKKLENQSALKITTETGRVIICSPDHQFAVCNGISGYNFVEAMSLSNDDKLFCKLGFNTNEASKLGLDLCWWLGATVGDGSYNDAIDYRVDFSNIPNQCGSIWKDISEKLFEVKVTERKTKSLANNYYFHSKKIRTYLYNLGLTYAKCPNKTIPSCIFNASKREISSFICGLIDTDGHVAKKSINIASSSLDVLYITKNLFEIIGYKSFISKDSKNWTGWKIHLFSHGARKFLSEHGDLLKSKNKYKNFENLKIYPYKHKKVQINDLPILDSEISKILEEIIEKYGKKYGNVKRLNLPDGLQFSAIKLKCNKHKFNRYDAHNFISKIVNFDKIGPICEKLSIFIENQFYSDSVVSIELVPNQTLIDISLDKEFEFYASGTLTHNCQGMTLDKAVVDMNGAFSAGMVYVALSRVRNLESLSIVDFPSSKIWVNQECLDFYKNIDKKVDSTKDDGYNLL